MQNFLIIKLKGPMQSWGGHTFEGRRPSEPIPTRSAVTGLLGACLGIRRNDHTGLNDLAQSIRMAVRKDRLEFEPIKITDYHTVLDARKSYAGLKSQANSIQTWREYLCDAAFTVCIWLSGHATVSLDQIKSAVLKPRFTPYLGRRSCPLSRPLFETSVRAEGFLAALDEVEPSEGEIYSDENAGTSRTLVLRDDPLSDRPRQFGSRTVYVYGGDTCI